MLAQSNFRYLDYEPRPLAAVGDIQLDGGGSKVLTDALTG
jgi:hypothetical protein